MEDLLTPVSTSYKAKDQDKLGFLVEVPRPNKATTPQLFSKVSTPLQALEILRNEPDYEILISTLRFLVNDGSDFSITSPGPVAAQLVHVLVSETVPTFWSIFQPPRNNNSKEPLGKSYPQSPKDLKLLLSCLRSVTGLNAILLSLKQYMQKSKEPTKAIGGFNIRDVLMSLLQLLSLLLEGKETIKVVSNSIWSVSAGSTGQKAIWNEFTGIVAGGKILGLSAEAEDIIGELSKDVKEKFWISDGTLYCKWLASNISHWSISLELNNEPNWKSCGELLGKSFRLGYTGKCFLLATSFRS
jgi:telomere length regulation protein